MSQQTGIPTNYGQYSSGAWQSWNNLDRITRPRVRLYAFPLLLEGADGSPARVLAEQAD